MKVNTLMTMEIAIHVTETEMLYAQDVFMIQVTGHLSVLNVFQVQALADRLNNVHVMLDTSTTPSAPAKTAKTVAVSFVTLMIRTS